MALTEQEKQIIMWGKSNGKTQQEVESALVKFRQSQPKQTQPEVEQPLDYIGRTKQAAKAGFSKMGTAIQESREGRNPLETGAKFGAGAIQTVFSPLSAALEPVIKPTIGKGIEVASDVISDIPAVQKFASGKGGEIAERGAELTGNLAEIMGVAAMQKIPKVTSSAVRTVESGVETVKTGVGKITQPVKSAIEGTKNVVGMVSEEAKRIPSRITTNVAEKQAVRQTIEQLPSNVAKNAARDGVELADIKTIYRLPKSQITPLKKLATVVKDFAEGKTKVNPIEVVGKPIISRIKQLESVRGKVGQKLGQVAENLGNVATQEVFPKVFDALKKVQGLSGLKVSPMGRLDFSDTVLASALSKSERAAIQKIFVAAIKEGTGKSKHLLRQELFEILGGKKRALTNITATQEQAYNAIRRGLSDVLESKNTAYKTLSNQYRKIAQPLQEIRGYMKKVAGAGEDVLDMSAGLLARRLTSLAKSNPEIRAVLNAMDKATAVAGKTKLSVEVLQDFYNILEKYYDIAPKTGFQSQVSRGVETATGVRSFIAEKVRGLAGETTAVRQKALENLLKEIFK